MRPLWIALSLLACVSAPALAESCPGNPDAIGTSRSITVDPVALPLIGTMQYKNTLPLEDHEVVITFDDGPIPPYSTHVLDTLKENCVKATYFLVGEMAREHPWLVRRIYNEGHTIGTHSETHPLGLDRKAMPRIEHEIDAGFESVRAAVGDDRAVAPYFRIPGLARSKPMEEYLAEKSIAVWSADEVADDWFRGISSEEIVRRAIRRIEAHEHRGVLLLHDIHPATALALPKLLSELKALGYHIVQVVPSGARPPSVPELAPPVAQHDAWPRIVKASVTAKRHHARHLLRHRHRAAHRRHQAANAEKAANLGYRGLWNWQASSY